MSLEGFEPSRYVTNVSIDNAIGSLAVKELKSSVEWYQRHFGRSPDSIPMVTVAGMEVSSRRVVTGIRVAGPCWAGILHVGGKQYRRDDGSCREARSQYTSKNVGREGENSDDH